jgi:chemotaxis protein MotB
VKRRATARKRTAEDEPPHQERWLVSYADFITLLFAFFVVMYSTSTLNEGKYRVLSDSLFSAFRHERLPKEAERIVAPAIAPPPLALRPQRPAQSAQQSVKPQREQRLRGLAVKINDALRSLVQSGQVRLAQTPNGLAVEINASVLFAPAQAVLRTDSIVALKAVAEMLADVDNPIEVEGHSDNVPISTPQYPSNWELASARASSVVRLFIDAGVASDRLVAAGHAANLPVDSNDTPEGRARNRRVTILIRAEAEPRAESALARADR